MSHKPTAEQIRKSLEQTKAIWGGTPGLTLAEHTEQRKALVEALRKLDNIKTSCTHCIHFCVSRCDVHKAEIPTDFQRREGACTDWQHDGIPF